MKQIADATNSLAVGDVGFMEWLIQRGANPNKKTRRGVTPLHTAVVMEMSDSPAFLLSHGAEMPSNILVYAISATIPDRMEMVRFLLENGADVDHIDPVRGSPLHRAAFMGMKEVAQLLLDAGANPNATFYEQTPDEVAKASEDMSLYDLLLAARGVS